jgi:hypothetical protein
MFLSDQRVLTVSIGAARARLANLVDGGWLGGASRAVYQEGMDHLVRVGPVGGLPGVSRLVRVQFLDPVDRGDSVTRGMRWEAIGVTGGLFPVLDANITLTTEGEKSTLMTLTAVYRPALGALGAGLDRVLLHRVAAATVHSLMTSMARALESPAPAAVACDLARVRPWALPRRAPRDGYLSAARPSVACGHGEFDRT